MPEEGRGVADESQVKFEILLSLYIVYSTDILTNFCYSHYSFLIIFVFILYIFLFYLIHSQKEYRTGINILILIL